MSTIIIGCVLTRRAFSAGIAPAVLVRGAQSEKYNLLFLMADDHAAYVHGADGNRLARTPNLDRLAAQSLRFSRHYCNSPVCTPSRQSLLTGLLPHAAGVTQLRTALADDRDTIARRLQEASYATAVFGKMHFNRPGTPGLHGFGHCMTEDVIGRQWNAQVKPEPLPEGTPTQTLPWRPFQTPARQWLNADKRPYPRRDADMRNTFVANEAMRWMRDNAKRPFALWASFTEPHSPFDFPVEDAALINPASFAVPRVGREDAAQIPLIFRDLSPQEKQGIIAAYYTSAAFLDRNVGRVLAQLSALGLEKNTLVVYTADHGYCLGQHGRFEKHCGYDPALRVPLMMRLPGRIKPGVVKEFTEHIDLGPAILETLGAPRLASSHGKSLLTAANRRDHVFSEYLENEEVFIRDARWKFVHCSGKRKREDGYVTDNPTPGSYTRLYDLRGDPGEFTDVSRSHPDVVKRFTSLALERFRATHLDAPSEPKGATPVEALEFYLRPRDNTRPAEVSTK